VPPSGRRRRPRGARARDAASEGATEGSPERAARLGRREAAVLCGMGLKGAVARAAQATQALEGASAVSD
jgi:hypothetical protein